jgi:hypothetical protein
MLSSTLLKISKISGNLAYLGICLIASSTSQQDDDSTGDTFPSWTKLCLFDCLPIYFSLFNFSIFSFITLPCIFYTMLMHKYIEYKIMPSCILIKPNSRLDGE